MKYLKLLVLAVAFIFAANTSYSQWTYCAGSINMTGLGSFPFISVVDANNVWVCGGTGGAPKVYRTTNGGSNFVNVTGSLTGPEFYAIWAIDANTCLVGDGGAVGGAGGNAKVWRTSDAGVTWTTVLTTGGTVGFFNGIAGVNSNRNFAFTQSDAPTGASQLVATTTNGGLNWTVGSTTSGGTTGGAGSVWCASTQVMGYGISGFARVSFSLNGGSTFTAGNLSVAGTFTSGFACNDAGSIMIAASSTSLPNISRSSNSGVTWANVAGGTGLTGTSVMKWLQTTNICYLTGATGTNGIRKSTDGGITWTTMTTSAITGFNDLAFAYNGSTAFGYAIAADGSVIKVSDLVGIDPSNTTTPTEFALQQNYPNPFNPTTTIKFSVPTAGNVTVKVYNSIGAEVMTVVNKDYAVGNYVELVDMSSFSSGIYFYTLTSGNFKDTKKMMLVK